MDKTSEAQKTKSAEKDQKLMLSNVPIKIGYKVPVDWLTLDMENPRLVGSSKQASNCNVIAQLYRGEELGELLQSISANGYLDIEPLIVLLKENGSSLVVLEGNRRLAAIMLFRNPELQAKIQEVEQLKIYVPEIDEAKKASLEQATVYRVESREAARAFIGFKHINGAAKWDSYAKAKFAAEWYKAAKVNLHTIAEQVGDKHDTIKRMVFAIYVLEQAEKDDLYSISDRKTPKFNFSHLYTALSRSTYMDFLGLDISWTKLDPQPNPVPAEKKPALQELLRWIYGSKADFIDPLVQSQNPDIKKLGEVLVNPEALHVLRTRKSLKEAHASTRTVDETFSGCLINARALLGEAATSLRAYNGKDSSLLDIATDVSETATMILARMQKKFNEIQAELTK